MHPNLLDVLLVVLIGLAAYGGWRLGFITRSLSWAGAALGLALAARLIPSVVASGRGSTGRGQLALISIGILVAGAALGQAVGLVVGNRLNLGVRNPKAQRLDSLGGAAAGVFGVVVVTWLVLPTLADIRGWPSRAVRHSEVSGVFNHVLPPPPSATDAVRRLLGQSYPQVFDALRPAPDAGPPPRSSGISPEVSRRVTRSIVKVVGQACGQVQEGSGFVADTDLVVTNAHVVAGEQRTVVQRSDDTTLRATVVAFDPQRDLALLRVPGLDRPALPLDEVERGGRGAVYGHPGGGPLSIAPFRVSERVTALGTDIYDRSRTRRDVLILAAQLEPGDSGSSLVDPTGTVVGIAFAIAPDRPKVAYALAVTELQPLLDAPHDKATDTGKCVD